MFGAFFAEHGELLGTSRKHTNPQDNPIEGYRTKISKTYQIANCFGNSGNHGVQELHVQYSGTPASGDGLMSLSSDIYEWKFAKYSCDGNDYNRDSPKSKIAVLSELVLKNWKIKIVIRDGSCNCT
eukprot:3242466-Amphidinium_carterae.1